MAKQQNGDSVPITLASESAVHTVFLDPNTHPFKTLQSGEYYSTSLDFPGGSCVLIVPTSLRAYDLEDFPSTSNPRFLITQVSPLRFIVDLVVDQPMLSLEMEQSLSAAKQQVQNGSIPLLSSREASDIFANLRERISRVLSDNDHDTSSV
jgi:hypothetical protein